MTKSKTPMTPEAAARIQGNAAKQNGGQVPKGDFAGRAQRAAAHNQKQGKQEFIMNKPASSTPKGGAKPNPNYPSTTGKPSGGGRGNTPKR